MNALMLLAGTDAAAPDGFFWIGLILLIVFFRQYDKKGRRR